MESAQRRPIKGLAEAARVSQAEIVDRAFRQFFSGREGLDTGHRRSWNSGAGRAIAGDAGATRRARQG